MKDSKKDYTSTICALATPNGTGAIAVIRVSGPDTFKIVDKIFVPVGKKSISETDSHKIRFGTINYSKDVDKLNDASNLVDEVLVSVFRNPHSFTGEDSVEISCHASSYIINEILMLLLKNGVKNAEPGEYTKRAFLNGKMDLTQAEAVADVIASETEAAHNVAMHQMKGGFSKELANMREELLKLVSLMELELDFSDQEVEFADRKQLEDLLNKIIIHVKGLVQSFKLGNVIKNGVPVTITGATNTGKSTLLNTLLGEERAIVSPVHGTTRDSIEDTINIDGITFRFIDTAGIRNATETIEIIGIKRAYKKIREASLIIFMLDPEYPEYFKSSLTNLAEHISQADSIDNKKVIIVLNKIDTVKDKDNYISNTLSEIKTLAEEAGLSPLAVLPVSSKKGLGIDKLKKILVDTHKLGQNLGNATLVTNSRHFEALSSSLDALNRAKTGLKMEIPSDLVSQDIREALYYFGTISGKITTDEVLGNIFENFCIGK